MEYFDTSARFIEMDDEIGTNTDRRTASYQDQYLSILPGQTWFKNV